MDVKDRISARRKALGLTLEQVGNYVGVSKSTVKKWETGYISNMRRDKIAKLAEVLKLSPTELMGWDDASSTIPYGFEPMPKMQKIPLVGTIACGIPIFADENIEEYVDLPEHIYADFALRCKGDSMIGARILDGDIVYIRKQSDVDDGQIAAVLIEDEATLKRVYKIGTNRVELRPENPSYPVFSYENEELNNIRIMGLAVAFTSPVNKNR